MGIVDPLGLFRTSPVVRMNELDERTIETTRNLINLLVSEADASGNTVVDASNFSGVEIQQLTSTLVRKVWSRRTGLVITGNRLGTKLLQLTADKLEGGERDILVLPTSTDDDNDEEINDGKIHSEAKVQPNNALGHGTNRIMNARKILENAERQESVNSL